MPRLPLSSFLFLLAVSSCLAEPAVLHEKRSFLGAPGVREWKDFDDETPEAPSFSLNFTSHANAAPVTLLIRQRDVKLRWTVLLNGQKLGLLELNEVLLETPITVPPGALREGENALSIVPQAEGDDIIIDRVRVDARPPEEALGEATLRLTATDAELHTPLPCRFTIVDAAGALTPVTAAPGQLLAVRTGVVYTGNGQAELRLPAGAYTVYLNRGFEYGLATRQLVLKAGQQESVALAIRREVPTPGLVACDPHVHTFTYSKHGDANLEERMLTLAGEGIELPIATDHNVYADYTEAIARTKVGRWFTWMLGCEVTTAAGHFLAFPVADVKAPLPDVKLTNWPSLMQSIRSVPGVQAVILNHPRNKHSDFIPFAPAHFNSASGDNLRGPEFTFDAVEVANSGSWQSDLSRSWRDWYALLNHGYRTVAVGTSDSHEVSRFVVGQGRTYVTCNDRDPGLIDPAEFLRNLKAGHALVSAGLLTTLTVDNKYQPGDTATGLGAEVQVKATVLGPSWLRAEKVELYANGERIREEKVTQPELAGEKAVFTWTLPKPAFDTYLVAIATGPGLREPYWSIPFPYQPQGRVRDPKVLGLTNPVFLDADGDGHYTSPRALAQSILTKVSADPDKLLPALAAYDSAVSTQAASLCEAQLVEIRGAAYQEALIQATAPVQRGFANYLAPPP